MRRQIKRFSLVGVPRPRGTVCGAGSWIDLWPCFQLRLNFLGACPAPSKGPHCGENHQFGHFPLELCGNFSHNEGRHSIFVDSYKMSPRGTKLLFVVLCLLL